MAKPLFTTRVTMRSQRAKTYRFEADSKGDDLTELTL
jgi:hypothetical protein